MAEPAFGILLRHLREERKLSLREVAELAEVDHSYIYRLETGEKDSPSEDVIKRLIKVLKPNPREREMLQFLADHAETDPALVQYSLENANVKFEEFESAAGVRFRGRARPDPAILIERIRKLFGEEA